MPSIKAIVLPLTPGMTSAEPIQKPFIIKFNFLKNIKCKRKKAAPKRKKAAPKRKAAPKKKKRAAPKKKKAAKKRRR